MPHDAVRRRQRHPLLLLLLLVVLLLGAVGCNSEEIFSYTGTYKGVAALTATHDNTPVLVDTLRGKLVVSYVGDHQVRIELPAITGSKIDVMEARLQMEALVLDSVHTKTKLLGTEFQLDSYELEDVEYSLGDSVGHCRCTGSLDGSYKLGEVTIKWSFRLEDMPFTIHVSYAGSRL